MKNFIEVHSSAVLMLLIMVQGAIANDRLVIKGGLEKPEFYSEMQATQRQNAGWWPPRKKGEKLYRYFTVKEHDGTYEDRARPLFQRHSTLWASYRKQAPKPSQEGYLQFVNDQDPFFAGSVKALAPVLYFDFIGSSGKEYVLEAVEVRIVAFEEYAGGGFFTKEAWYDITLRHQPGAKRYEVEKKLQFVGSGRAELRFWSDNYYPSMGMAPMGCYTIEIVFHFRVDGKSSSVSTGIFKIDV
jgi:hypothetical protein